jgi:hypothetical protein
MRAFLRLLSVVLAAAIAVAGVLIVIEVIAAAVGADPVIVKWHGLVDDLARNQWKTAPARVTAIVLIVVGLVLLFFALRRGKPSTVALTTGATDVDMTTTRRSLQRFLASSATEVDGITDAKSRVKRRTVVIRAVAGSGVERDDARSRLTDHLQQRLDALSLSDQRRLKVKVTTTPDKRTPETPANLSSGGGAGGAGGQPDGGTDTAQTSRVGATASNPGAGSNPGGSS